MKTLLFLLLLCTAAFAQVRPAPPYTGGTGASSLTGIIFGHGSTDPFTALALTGDTTYFLNANGTFSKPLGTVTSVGLSLPNIFSLSGSPITSSGTITATLVSQTANKVFASPDGASGAPTFRALTATDIPSLNYQTPLTFSTGLTNTSGTVTVNTSQNISTLSNLTMNGFVKTSGGTGALSIDNSTYLTSAVTSVGLTGNNGISILNSPITTTGTMTIGITNGSIGDSSLASTFLKTAVTSVAATAGNGLTVSGSPITTTGTLTFGIANGSIGDSSLASTFLKGNQTITLSGDVSGSGATSITTAIGSQKVTTAMLKDTNVTYLKLQHNVLTNYLLGATTAYHDVQPIKLGTNLSMSNDTLNATGGGSSADMPPYGSDTTLFLRNDSVWAAPPSGGGGLTHWTESESTTSPNNTVYVDRLQANGSATNADAVISPKGTGALLGMLPDGTATGGNKRGAYAVDWQLHNGGSALDVASGSSAVIGGGYLNQASGSYSTVAGGDHGLATNSYTAICGGQSNTASGSNSSIIGGYGNTAAGSYSVVAGGYNNTANDNCTIVGSGYGNNISNGIYSSILGGYNNSIGGRYASILGGQNNNVAAGGYWSTILGGNYGHTINYGQVTFACGEFGSVGDAQTSFYVLRRQTTDATPTELFIDGSSAEVSMAAKQAFTFHILIIGKETGSVAPASFTIDGCAYNNAGTVTITANTVTTINQPAGYGAPTVSGSGTSFQINVTGKAATTIDWVARCETSEVTF